MKTLVIGDIHGKSIWQDIVNKEQADRIIFLGDYVTTHGYETPKQQVDNLKNIFEFVENKRAEGIEVILLRGNHCMQMLGYDWASCSGWNQELYELLIPLKQKYLDMTQWIYHDGDIVFSHAGISTEWMEWIAGIKSIDEINDLPPSEIFGFTPCEISDYCGTSPTQPPTWIRPQTLIEYMPEGIIQVVGHTPIKYVVNLGERFRNGSEKIKCPDLWCCDTLDVKEYLIIEDGLFIPKKLNEYESTSN